MNSSRIFPGTFALKLLLITMALLNGGASTRACGNDSDSETFVGTTPCGPGVRRFLGVSSDSECAQVKWRLLLHREGTKTSPKTFTLVAIYGFIDYDTNLILQKETNTFYGKWLTNPRQSSRPGETVYELKSDQTGISLRLKKIDENLLQILTTNGNLMVGDEFQSYTLNALNTQSTPAATPSVEDRITSSETSGNSVFGTFRGRTPCKEIAAELGWPEREECAKRKLVVTLNQDPITRQPTTFKFRGLGDTFTEGSWTVVEGAREYPRAVVFRLTATGSAKPIHLLRGDDNVLFFLKSDRTFLVGNANYSYTLNRQEHPTKWPGYVAP
jgi:hypothetical protein